MLVNIYLNRVLTLNKRLILSAFPIIVFACFPYSACAEISIFTQYISEHNLEQHKLSLTEKTYRGEEGILRINPEVGRSLGLQVFINQDYLKATDLYDEAEKVDFHLFPVHPEAPASIYHVRSASVHHALPTQPHLHRPLARFLY